VLVAGARLLSSIVRPVAATGALAVLLGLHPERARLVRAASAQSIPAANTARTLIVSDQARRYLALQYRSYPTEFLGCMIGEVRDQTVLVHRIAPADVDPSQSTTTSVVARQTCESAGWTGTVGMIHSHPSGDRCWYYFPGTQVPSSDGQSFLRWSYPVDAIMCGDRVVWTGRDLVQRELVFALVGEGSTAGLASR
jgi:hypothetical protein